MVSEKRREAAPVKGGHWEEWPSPPAIATPDRGAPAATRASMRDDGKKEPVRTRYNLVHGNCRAGAQKII